VGGDLRGTAHKHLIPNDALNHPNITTIQEIGEQDGRTFIVMELELRDVINRPLAGTVLSYRHSIPQSSEKNVTV
jgi:hypothetical protein